MKILVIGASGMLASPVIRMLEEAGHQLRLFSRNINPSMFINEYEIVQGDLYNPVDLELAVEGCDAIHITISTTDEEKATAGILHMAKEKKVKRISMISGCTVSEDNRWFNFIDKKYKAEILIKESGIPYSIFRPTWFFESLEMLVRNGKAMLPGRQDHPYHWVAADDLGRMVARAYSVKENGCGIYYVYGPERYRMKDLLEKYCHIFYPDIQKVSMIPIPVLKMIAFITGNRSLKFAASLFAYFEKVREPEISTDKLSKLIRPEIDFEAWVKSRK